MSFPYSLQSWYWIVHCPDRLFLTKKSNYFQIFLIQFHSKNRYIIKYDKISFIESIFDLKAFTLYMRSNDTIHKNRWWFWLLITHWTALYLHYNNVFQKNLIPYLWNVLRSNNIMIFPVSSTNISSLYFIIFEYRIVTSSL